MQSKMGKAVIFRVEGFGSAEQARIASARALHMTWNLVFNKNLQRWYAEAETIRYRYTAL